MNQEDAYRAYDCVRKEFPEYANFEGCPWIETKTGWARSNRGYLLEVQPTKVKVSGPPLNGERSHWEGLGNWEQEWHSIAGELIRARKLAYWREYNARPEVKVRAKRFRCTPKQLAKERERKRRAYWAKHHPGQPMPALREAPIG